MSKSPSPYYVETISGKLQLTKGAYLTMMKRKSSAVKTLIKSKPISRNYSRQCSKKTVKKTSNLHHSLLSSNKIKMIQSVPMKEMMLKDRESNIYIFQVQNDKDIFGNKFPLPSIQMQYDNDNQSEWAGIEINRRQMVMSLSIATYDRLYHS